MNATPEEIAQNGAQTLETPTVGETNAASQKPQRTQNTGSKRLKDRKKLNLNEKILEIKKLIAADSNSPITINIKGVDADKILESLEDAPITTVALETTLTPAMIFDVLLASMNAYGVDWWIASEKPTQRDANGSETCYKVHKLSQSNTGLWVYEATLEIMLVNVDNADQTELAELHAVGTSKTSLNTARSNAWRSCLVSFFASRFNAPKIADVGSVAENGETPAAPQNGANSPQTGTQNGKTEPKPLSGAQLNRLYRKAEAAGVTKEQAVARILEKYDRTDPALMTREEYDEICGYYDDLARGR
jgi:hypothetical protein